MNTKSEKRIKNTITFIMIATLIGVIAYAAYAIATDNLQIPVFQTVLGSFLLIYFVLLSIVEPILLKRFENITNEQKQAYLKFLGIDALGIGCLLFFVYSMGNIDDSGSNIGLYAALGYLFTSRFKYKFKNQFLGIEEKKEETEEEESEEAQEKEETEEPEESKETQDKE